MTPVSEIGQPENPYEAQRARNIARNAAMLATLEVASVLYACSHMN